jgi:hypothetical protein
MKQRKNVDTEFERRLQVGEEYDPENPDSNWLKPGVIRPEQPTKLIQGYEWSKVPGIDERLEECLWNAGILQLQDLEKTSLIVSALQAYYGFDAGQLRTRVKEFENEQH